MKFVMVVIGGAADRPVSALYGKTPLQAAHLPVLDRLSEDGLVGMVDLLPGEAPLCPEAAAMALLGYDPVHHFTGPGPLDAAGREIPMERGDVAFRVDLVSSDGEKVTDTLRGGISPADGEVLFRAVGSRLRTQALRFYANRGRRHVLVWRDGPVSVHCLPPNEALGRPLIETMPKGDGEFTLRDILFDSMDVLDAHLINSRRRDAGKPPANMIWPWGPGRLPTLSSFPVTHGVGGAVVSPATYFRGVGLLAGLAAPDLPGATGRVDTDYEGKVQVALEALTNRDFVVIHAGGPGAASVQGDPERKIAALERVDERLLAPLLDGLKHLDDYRLLVVPDLAIPVEERAPTREPVPFVLSASGGVKRAKRAAFDESALEESPLRIEEGHRLIELLLRG